jgi:hypothetical protein
MIQVSHTSQKILHRLHLIRDITWLKGFENCSNYLLFLFNHIQLELPRDIFSSNLEPWNLGSYFTLRIYDNSDRIGKVKRDYRKNLFCQTVSIVYSDQTTDLHVIQNAIQQLTIPKSDLNPISAETPNGTIQVLPSY